MGTKTMAGMFPAVVGTYATRASAELQADLLWKHGMHAQVTSSLNGQAWIVDVPVSEYPQADHLTRAAKLMGELPEPPE